MKRRVSITIPLVEDRDYARLFERLQSYGAEHKLPAVWFVVTSLNVEEMRRELQPYLDPADRILVAQLDIMSSQNLISDDDFGQSAA